MNKIIISSRQLGILLSGVMFGSAPLLISSSVAALAGPDSWISIIIATVVGLLVVWINTILAQLHPGKTILEVIQIVLGKWLGGFMAVCFVLITFITGTQVAWYVGDFFTTMYMAGTSSYYINILFVAVLAIALLYGLEAMFRATEIIFMLGFPLMTISLIMLAPQVKVDNLLPIMENGIGPAIKGVIPIMSFVIMPIILLNMVFPANIVDFKKAKKAMFVGYFLGIIVSAFAIMFCVLVLGSTVTANLRFPLFTVTKEINVGTIFSRVEALVVFVWIVTNFISTYAFLYASIKGLSQLLKLKDYKTLVLPFCLIVAVYSGIIYDNVPYEIRWDSEVWTPVSFTFGLFLPLLLLIVSLIRKKFNKQQEGCSR
ncbi:GerAB/ArcD/ProY family transporter [Acetivibrio cellulolyticus]|uniref:GerAB/ArcD/ProY family transporter n=1 Tax=Acetivibrio cellulolyticus TaxID=35830 RepID=UPI0001E2D48E|nr:endospore germination permease [Acetivibrio cellulolyticus]